MYGNDFLGDKHRRRQIESLFILTRFSGKTYKEVDMRELNNSEVAQVNGGNPLVGGAIGGIAGGVTAYSEGGGAGDVIMGATTGFATGFFGGVAWAARSVYYGAVTVGMAVVGGGMGWQESDS